MTKEFVLVINPGSTSTKVAVFRENDLIIQENLTHSAEALSKYEHIADQFDFRTELILSWYQNSGYSLNTLKAVIGRGGLLKPMPSGIYEVTDAMMEDLKIGIQGQHASNLGGLIADLIAKKAGVKAYIADPVAVDEFDEVARISGIPEIKRKSLVHALNIKATAHRYEKEQEKDLKDMNLIVAHIGGGISVAPMIKGKIVDVNNANEMGPFSPERAGTLPVGDVVKMCFSGAYTEKELKTKINNKGGLVGYLGTNDAREVMKRIEAGDLQAKLIFDAMGYQIAKEIGAMAAVLEGRVDAILLTGGVAYSKYLTDLIASHVGFIAPVVIKPGEDEMTALNESALRVLNEVETAKIYENEVN
ncbi:butyrate kinase [Acidaminobacter sp.]|uniref:butyrate kinase n=1 Tax=Acidaminobacter sp. TaxID=1872102 RepID=UPI00138315F7|nr:butyrate kinase [Acidaminobacter sp.]MDK9711696.1 butyrate kinase [Acidaminobacter sp.]MZQ98646.1 butyrate kinase [Acidaminobacter sp.]